MVWASAAWMAVEILRKLWGDAAPSPYRVLSVAPGRRVWRRFGVRVGGGWELMVMNEAARAPVPAPPVFRLPPVFLNRACAVPKHEKVHREVIKPLLSNPLQGMGKPALGPSRAAQPEEEVLACTFLDHPRTLRRRQVAPKRNLGRLTCLEKLLLLAQRVQRSRPALFVERRERALPPHLLLLAQLLGGQEAGCAQLGEGANERR